MNPIEEALELLRENGWTQEVAVNKKGERCIHGALYRMSLKNHNSVVDRQFSSREEEIAFRNLTEETIGEVAQEQYPEKLINFNRGYYGLIAYINDFVLENFDEVERLLQKAAQRYEEKLYLE